MDPEQFTPEELQALADSGELTVDDLKLLSKQDSLVALDLLIKNGTAKAGGGPVMPPVGGALATVGSILGVGAANGKAIWNKAAPQVGGAIGAIAGKSVGHPWAGWNAGHEIGKRLKFSQLPSAPGRAGGPPSKPPLDATKAGLGRVPRDGGIVEGSGGKPQITVTDSHPPSNLIRENKQDFHASGMSNSPIPPRQSSGPRRTSPSEEMASGGPTAEAAQRNAKFGGLNPESASGQYPSPSARGFQNPTDWGKVVRELLKDGKSGNLTNKSTIGQSEGEMWSAKLMKEVQRVSGGSGAKAVPSRGTRPAPKKTQRRTPK
jgi:hypothetical protein